MEKKYSLWLHQLQIDEHTKYTLFKYFGGCREIFEADYKVIETLHLKAAQLEKLIDSKRHMKEIELCVGEAEERGFELITIEQQQYPALLKQLPDPPMVLFAKGNIKCLERPMIGIVGARKCSEYGYLAAEKIGEDLAGVGVTVVSGMAKGIDEAAHRGALKKGYTVAVLGTGADLCYPASNRRIYEKIAEKGCILSEFGLGVEGLPFHFPKRNRIISGLSLGTIVIEAAEKSGSLITADLALEQNREVFAVPGNIDSSLSKGTNALIQKGCKLIMNYKDVLDEFPEYVIQNLQYNKENGGLCRQNILDKVEIIVYDCLGWHPVSLETLSIGCKIEEKIVQHTLLKLELQGLVKRLPANRYIRNNANN